MSLAGETTLATPYDAEFFGEIAGTAIQSARVVVPMVIGLLHPKSVLDLGGGTGSWAAVFAEHGVEDVLCVDGPYVERASLRVPPGRFFEADVAKRLDLNRRFDLTVCLEVAEHLPVEDADTLIESTVRHADAVLFSAAIPHQGGTHHVNLQWPAYWARKYCHRGYRCFDCVRFSVWDDESVAGWYKQNTLLYLNDSALNSLAADSPVRGTEVDEPRAIVHPDTYLTVVGHALRTPRVGAAFRTLARSAKRSIQHRASQTFGAN